MLDCIAAAGETMLLHAVVKALEPHDNGYIPVTAHSKVMARRMATSIHPCQPTCGCNWRILENL